MEDILKKAASVSEQAELFLITSEETPVNFEANRLKHIQGKQSTSLALRLIKNGRIGYAITTHPNGGQELIDMALETAQFGQPAVYDFPPPAEYPTVDIYDKTTADVPVAEMVKLGQGLIDTVTSYNPAILCEASASKASVSVTIYNSSGSQASYRKSIFGLGVEGMLTRGTDMLFVGDGETASGPIRDTKEIGERVLNQLKWAENQAKVTSKTMPVILTPNGVASALMPSLMSALNGKTVLEGASPLGDKVGQAVFDKKFSLADDSTINCRPGSRPFDDEGVPSRRTPLITEGVAQGFLYDLRTAAKAKTTSTGNGERGGGGLPSPSPSALVISSGQTSFSAMLADIKEGLVVEYLMGASQGNMLGGDFQGNVLLGYKVENGKITGRVKDTMVSGNIYQALKDIAATGSDSRWISGSLKTPSIYLPALTVAAK